MRVLSNWKRVIFIVVAVFAMIFFAFKAMHQTQAVATNPTLPLSTVDSAYPALATGHTVYNVRTSCSGVTNCYNDLQSAIDKALPGEEITIQAKMLITGTIDLPNKTCTNTDQSKCWIIIRSANLPSLPAAGNRVAPSDSANMPKIVAPGDQASHSALQVLPGAHYYRLVGIEFAKNSISGQTSELVSLGANDATQTTSASVPHHIVLDRIYAHGEPTANLKRCVGLDSAWTAVVDSYLSDCHVVGQDAQAIGGANSPGPVKILNNYLEGAGENVLFGGDDPKVPNLITSDIEVRNNYFYKPRTWKVGDPSYAGYHWAVKNLFELKNAQRVLADGNIFDGDWVDGQAGRAIVFTPRNQGGTCTWCVVRDVTFSNNIVRHVSAGFNILGHDNLATSQQTQRIKIYNNLWDDVGGTMGGDGKWGLMDGGTSAAGPTDVQVVHNTAFQTGNAISPSSYYSGTNTFSTKPNTVITDNVAPHNKYGILGDTSGVGDQTIADYFTGASLFTKNILMAGPSKSYANNPGNYFPADWSSVFVNQAAGDYHIISTSIYHNAGTDGKDLGANIDAVDAATATVISGQSASQINFTPPPSSTPDTIKPVVSIFDVQPRSGASVVTATFSATDTGGSYLASAELLRAAYNSTNCLVGNITGCSWVHTQTIYAPVNVNSWNGSFLDSPAAARYLYGVHVHDGAGNIGFEPAIIDTTVSSGLQRIIAITSLEGRSSKITSGQLLVLNAANTQLKSYAISTDSTGQANVNFDIPTQVVNLKLSSTPFLVTELPNIDLSTSVPYTFGVLKTGDLNHDNIVNSVDYSTLNGKWFSTDAVSDLNQDGLVNSLDFSLLNKNWFVSGQ